MLEPVQLVVSFVVRLALSLAVGLGSLWNLLMSLLHGCHLLLPLSSVSTHMTLACRLEIFLTLVVP